MSNLRELMRPVLERSQEISRDLLKHYSRSSEVKIVDQKLDGLDTTPLTGQIIIAGESLEIVFRTHFHIVDAEKLTSNRESQVAINEKLALDFICEYCNVVSGKMKTFFDGSGIVLAQGLPFIIKGPVGRSTIGKQTTRRTVDTWGLETPVSERILCSMTCEIMNRAVLVNLARVGDTLKLAGADGDVELF